MAREVDPMKFDPELFDAKLRRELKRAIRKGFKFEPDVPITARRQPGGMWEFSQRRSSLAELHRIANKWLERWKGLPDFTKSQRENPEIMKAYEHGLAEGHASGMSLLLAWIDGLIDRQLLESVPEFKRYIKTKDEATKAERDSLKRKVPTGKRARPDVLAHYLAMRAMVEKSKGVGPTKTVTIYCKENRIKGALLKRLKTNFPPWYRRNFG